MRQKNPDTMSPREAQDALVRALLEELQHERITSTKALELLASQVTNNVLQVELIIIPAEGFVTRQWGIPCGSVAVTPLTAASVLTIVSGAAAGGTPPTSGIGVAQAIGGAAGVAPVPSVFNIAARSVTIYGTAGHIFNLQAFSKPQPPA